MAFGLRMMVLWRQTTLGCRAIAGGKCRCHCVRNSSLKPAPRRTDPSQKTHLRKKMICGCNQVDLYLPQWQKKHLMPTHRWIAVAEMPKRKKQTADTSHEPAQMPPPHTQTRVEARQPWGEKTP